MQTNSPSAPGAAPTRFQRIVTTTLLIALSALILKDLLVRRWGSAPPAPDVTRRLP
jgi:hypothetical protein